MKRNKRCKSATKAQEMTISLINIVIIDLKLDLMFTNRKWGIVTVFKVIILQASEPLLLLLLLLPTSQGLYINLPMLVNAKVIQKMIVHTLEVKLYVSLNYHE